MKKALLVNTLILTGTSLLLRTVGMSFRVYISNKIGAEGMGLYQLILSVYIMAITLATSGISIAVTKLVAEEKAKGQGASARGILKKSLVLGSTFGLLALIFLFFGADYISVAWLKDERTVLPLKILALSLPFIGISSCLKGYFIAEKKAIKPASSQILEQFTEIFVVVNILNIFLPRGLEHACAGIVIGITASEAVSCFYMIALYFLEKNRKSKHGALSVKPKNVFKRIFSMSLPVAASSYVRSGLYTVENILIPSGFEKSGTSKEASLAEFGMLKSMVLPLLVFPSALLSAFSTLLIPELSEANALNQKSRVNYIVSRVLQMTLLMSILVSGVFIAFSGELGMAVYHSEKTGVMLRVLAPLVPLIYLDMVVDGMMNGLNQQMSSLKYNIIDSLTRIVMFYYLIPLKGVAGFIIVLFSSNILNSFLSINRLLKVTMLKINFLSLILMPALSATASGFIATIILSVTKLKRLSVGVEVTIGIILMTVLYLIFLLLLECINKEDIGWLKEHLKI